MYLFFCFFGFSSEQFLLSDLYSINLCIYSTVSPKRWRGLKVSTRRRQGGKNVGEKWKVSAGIRKKQEECWHLAPVITQLHRELKALLLPLRTLPHSDGSAWETVPDNKNPELFTPKTWKSWKIRPDCEHTWKNTHIPNISYFLSTYVLQYNVRLVRFPNRTAWYFWTTTCEIFSGGPPCSLLLPSLG